MAGEATAQNSEQTVVTDDDLLGSIENLDDILDEDQTDTTPEEDGDDDSSDETTEDDDDFDDYDEEEDDDAGEDDESEFDDEDDGDDDEAAASESGRYVGHDGRVKLPNGNEISVGELIGAQSRLEDYQRRETELSAKEQEFGQAIQAAQAVAQTEQQVREKLEFAEALIQEFMPQMPAIPDPNDFEAVSRAQTATMLHAQMQQKLQTVQDRLNEDRNGANQKALEDFEARKAHAWRSFVGRHQNLADETVGKQWVDDFNRIMQTQFGFTAEELARIDDPRMLEVSDRAVRFVKAQKKNHKRDRQRKRGKKNANGSDRAPVTRSQRRGSKESAQYANKKALSRNLRETGNPRAAEKLIEGLLDE